MRILGPERKRTRFLWVIFVFLFAVFAFSSWKFYNSSEGYYAADAQAISEEAMTGSLSRQISLTALGGFSLVYLLRKGRSRIRVNGILGMLFIFYLAWIVLSLIWTVDPWLTGKAVLRFILMCLGALAVAKTLSLRETVILAFYMCLLTLLISVFYELSLGALNPFDTSWRLSGVMHPVSQGWNCGLLSLSALFLMRNMKKGHTFYFFIFIISLFFLLFTKSRMAFSAAVLAISVYFYLTSTRPQRIALLIIPVISICVVYFIAGDDIIKNSANILSFGRGIGTIMSINTLTGRIPLWEECLRYANNSPIWGYGYNTFLTSRFLLNVSESSGWMSSPHSGYIATLLELGIIGVILLVSTLGTAIKASIVISGRNPEYAFSVCVLVWLSTNLVLESFLISSPFFATFLVIVILEKLSFTSEERPNIRTRCYKKQLWAREKQSIAGEKNDRGVYSGSHCTK